MEMAKKKPHGHNIGGSSKQKRRKEKKGKSQISQEKIQDKVHKVFLKRKESLEIEQIFYVNTYREMLIEKKEGNTIRQSMYERGIGVILF